MLKRNPDKRWECRGPAQPGFQPQVSTLYRVHESHEAGTTRSGVVKAGPCALDNGESFSRCWQVPQPRWLCSFCMDLMLSPTSFTQAYLRHVAWPPHRSCTPELHTWVMCRPPGHLLVVAWPSWDSPHLLPLLPWRQLLPLAVTVCPLTFTLTGGYAQGHSPRPG